MPSGWGTLAPCPTLRSGLIQICSSLIWLHLPGSWDPGQASSGLLVWAPPPCWRHHASFRPSQPGLPQQTPQTGWPQQQTCASHGSGGRKARDLKPAWRVPREGPPPGLQVPLSLCAPMWGVRVGSGSCTLVSSLSQKDTNPITGSPPTLTTSSNPDVPEAPPPGTATLCVRGLARGFWGRTVHCTKLSASPDPLGCGAQGLRPITVSPGALPG